VVVAIDGPAGAGKSTIAKRLAEKTGFFYLNSGNFYRAITYAVLQQGIDPNDSTNVIEAAKTGSITLKNDRIHFNRVDIEKQLHTDAVDAWVAEISAVVEVRAIVNDLLREIAKGRDIIAEGRDITTVVFPHAEVKVYLDASIETRAKRRFGQGVSSLSLEEIEENIRKRDTIDKNKPVGSLKISSEALYLDTSDLTIDAVCEKVLQKIQETE
jgi:cytidylate kinase